MLCIGGFIAAVYEVFALKNGFSVGNQFRRNGMMPFVGSIIVLISLVVSIFVNPWWIIIILIILAWLLGQLLINFFGAFSQPLSLLLVLVGLILLFLYII